MSIWNCSTHGRTGPMACCDGAVRESSTDAAHPVTLAVTPPRETLHEETLRFLDIAAQEALVSDGPVEEVRAHYAYAAQCVRDVAALREQAEALTRKNESLARLVESNGRMAEEKMAQRAALRAENARLAEQVAVDRIQNPLFNRWPIELSDAEDAAMKAMLDSHHCGAPDEDEGKYCGGCVNLAWAMVRASRIKGAEEYKAAIEERVRGEEKQRYLAAIVRAYELRGESVDAGIEEAIRDA